MAQQVAREAEILSGDMGVRSIAVYGGVGYGPQLEAFQKGAHLVVGTPGRVLDHLLKRSLTLKHLEVLVFDEADRLLSMGFYPDMQQVKGYLPERRMLASLEPGRSVSRWWPRWFWCCRCWLLCATGVERAVLRLAWLFRKWPTQR